MDIKGLGKGIITKLHKYKFAVLIALIGILLMLIPGKDSKISSNTTQTQAVKENTVSIKEELEAILSQIKGAGKVTVMLKEHIGEERIYQVNEDITTSDTGTSKKISSVTVVDADRNETGLVKKTISPTYLGAIILCQGADDPAVKLAISDAVSKITGLGTDKIAVLKMK